MSLVLPEIGIKLSMNLNEEGTEFTLKVNGRSVYALPYIYDSNVEEDAKQTLEATIKINKKRIAVPSPWYQVDFIKNINKSLGDENISINDAKI